jgi:hypothetical protein
VHPVDNAVAAYLSRCARLPDRLGAWTSPIDKMLSMWVCGAPMPCRVEEAPGSGADAWSAPDYRVPTPGAAGSTNTASGSRRWPSQNLVPFGTKGRGQRKMSTARMGGRLMADRDVVLPRRGNSFRVKSRTERSFLHPVGRGLPDRASIAARVVRRSGEGLRNKTPSASGFRREQWVQVRTDLVGVTVGSDDAAIAIDEGIW